MTGIELITKERDRQIVEKGYTPEEDRRRRERSVTSWVARFFALIFARTGRIA